MISNDKLLEYLSKKIPDFTKTNVRGTYRFTCPYTKKHTIKSPTATFINGTDKISCLVCGYKGTYYDVIRLLEEDKKSYTDAQIGEYLMNIMEIDTYSELEHYKKYNWSLLPIAKNSKVPIEKGWTEIIHKEKCDWIKWLDNGLNMGVRCGDVSGISVIDADLKVPPSKEYDEVLKLLHSAKTLEQNSPHGKHFVFSYDAELKTTAGLGGFTLDIRNDGSQIVCQPSKRDNLDYHWVNLGSTIKPIPEEIKIKLLELQNTRGRSEVEVIKKDTELEPIKLKNNNLEGCCNDTFVRMGGLFIKRLSPDQTEFVFSVMNTQLLEKPMKPQAIKAMLSSLEGYKETESKTIKQQVYDYGLQMETVKAEDIIRSCFNNDHNKRAIVDKYLSEFHKDGLCVKIGVGVYQFKEPMQWEENTADNVEEINFKMPYFNDIAIFQDGDMLLLGGKRNSGKTTFAMNIIKQLTDQGIKPYYISSEGNSRFKKLANSFGLEGKFKYKLKSNPFSIILPERGVTIIDWLDFAKVGFEKTSIVLGNLNEELLIKRGILIIFTQLTSENQWFAPNLIDQYPSLAGKWLKDSDKTGHWVVEKIKEGRGNYTEYDYLPCEFNYDTKEIKGGELI
ncbi:MAG: bifunctional DNA primase/polymerase [Candidatus Margulisbacteria bacterium]|nr:bifunctional DNA primase/polymerase [Candidatus Margulisiibacteriota bacterium]